VKLPLLGHNDGTSVCHRIRLAVSNGPSRIRCMHCP